MKIALDLEVPQIPNFIRIKLPNGDYTTVSIAELSPEQLHEIGKLWTGKLVEEASRKKKIAQSISPSLAA